MITNAQELEAIQERIRRFQAQVTHLRKVETNPVNYRLSASGFFAEIDRMQLEVREFCRRLREEQATSGHRIVTTQRRKGRSEPDEVA
jgi:hypothetical protein